MKEAAGEANLTVVAIILIAVVVAVATPLVNSLMKTAKYRSCCTDAGGVWESGTCAQSAGASSANTLDTAGYTSCAGEGAPLKNAPASEG